MLTLLESQQKKKVATRCGKKFAFFFFTFGLAIE